MQLTSGMDVFTHVCRQKADTSSNYCEQYSAIWQETFQFLSNVTRFFRFFWGEGGKLPQIWTSNFYKVAHQHTEHMVASIMWILLEIYLSLQQRKNFKNPLRIDKVIAMSLVYYFLGHSIWWLNTQYHKRSTRTANLDAAWQHDKVIILNVLQLSLAGAWFHCFWTWHKKVVLGLSSFRLYTQYKTTSTVCIL